MADPLKLFRLLGRHEVKYVVMDRVAAALDGVPVLAFSTAIFPYDSDENNARLAQALNEIHPRLRRPQGAFPVTVDPALLDSERRELGIGIGVSFVTDFGIVDLIYSPAGVENSVNTEV